MTADAPDWRSATLEHATDIGPAPTPPAWCKTGSEPTWEKLPPEYGGGTACTWGRDIGDVWIAAEDHIVDGRFLRTPPRIHFFESPRLGIDPAGARMMAAQLLDAADVIDDQAVK